MATDSAFHSTEQIQQHKAAQAEYFTNHLSDEHHPNLVMEIWQLRRQLENLSPQLYLQSISLSELIYSVLYHADIFFAFREPAELGSYHWTIDAKGRDGRTNWEDWWSKIILPVTQSKTMREPLVRVSEGDFSHHDKFRTAPDEYLLQFMKSDQSGEFFDLRPVLTNNFRFSSECEYGLEAVDIVANTNGI